MDKFIAKNWFDKKIILLNKMKICFSTNITFNKLLKKSIVINVISL